MKKAIFYLLLMLGGGCSTDSPYFIEVICNKGNETKVSSFRINKKDIQNYLNCKYCEGYDTMWVNVYGLEGGFTVQTVDTLLVCRH